MLILGVTVTLDAVVIVMFSVALVCADAAFQENPPNGWKVRVHAKVVRCACLTFLLDRYLDNACYGSSSVLLEVLSQASSSRS